MSHFIQTIACQEICKRSSSSERTKSLSHKYPEGPNLEYQILRKMSPAFWQGHRFEVGLKSTFLGWSLTRGDLQTWIHKVPSGKECYEDRPRREAQWKSSVSMDAMKISLPSCGTKSDFLKPTEVGKRLGYKRKVSQARMKSTHYREAGSRGHRRVSEEQRCRKGGSPCGA